MGDTVEIFGQTQSVDSLAAILNTIPYELTCAVSKRVPRLYMENGKEIERSLRLLEAGQFAAANAALGAEITQEGMHRRLKPISRSCVFADWEPSSKQARFIRHWRRFACFPAR